MLHNEHLRKADESYEIRHDYKGNAIHVYITDGYAIIFRSLHDLVKYIYFGDMDCDRFYVPEHALINVYDQEKYSFDDLVPLMRVNRLSGEIKEKPFEMSLEFKDLRNNKLVRLSFIVTKNNEWITHQEYQIHYSEHYGDVAVFDIDGRDELYTQKI